MTGTVSELGSKFEEIRRELNDVLPTAINLFLKGETKKKKINIACIKAILQCVLMLSQRKVKRSKLCWTH